MAALSRIGSSRQIHVEPLASRPRSWRPIAGRLARVGIGAALLFTVHSVRAQEQDPSVYERVILADSSASTMPGPGRSLLILVREQFARRDPMPPEGIWVDDRAVGLLAQNSWFTVSVDTGTHVVWGVLDTADHGLRCGPGRVYLLRLRETINATDELSRDWLREDPEALARLRRQDKLQLALTTPKGLEWMNSRRRTFHHVPATRQEPAVSGRADTLAFAHMLSERPLDPLFVGTDFSNASGRLWLNADSLHFRMADRLRSGFNTWTVVRDSFDLALSRVRKVRFGGTRFSNLSPWIDVIYDTGEGAARASFGDTEERTGVETYNQLFAFLEESLRRQQARRPDTSAPGH